MRFIKAILFISFVTLFSSKVYALNLCEDKSEYLIGFFNGVLNSDKQAGESLDLLKKRYGYDYKGTTMNYDVFYNTSLSLRKDVWEAVAMRKLDDKTLPEGFLKLPGDTFDHYELFWYPAVIENGKKTIDTEGIHNTLVNLVSLVKKKVNDKLKKNFEQTFPEYMNDVKEHKLKIMRHIQKQEKILLIAHSQGNLFVNLAI